MSDPSATPRVETLEAMRTVAKRADQWMAATNATSIVHAALVADRLIAAAVREALENAALEIEGLDEIVSATHVARIVRGVKPDAL